MMRALLHGASLGSEYWTFTIRHSVYLRNRLPHMSLRNHITLFEQLTSRKPDLSHLRVFGSHVVVKHSGNRRVKIDDSITAEGIFLAFTATDRNIVFKDTVTQEIKTARHVTFNEAHLTSNKRPTYAQKLLDMVDTNLASVELEKKKIYQLPATLQPVTKDIPVRDHPLHHVDADPGTSRCVTTPPSVPTDIHTSNNVPSDLQSVGSDANNLHIIPTSQVSYMNDYPQFVQESFSPFNSLYS